MKQYLHLSRRCEERELVSVRLLCRTMMGQTYSESHLRETVTSPSHNARSAIDDSLIEFILNCFNKYDTLSTLANTDFDWLGPKGTKMTQELLHLKNSG